MCEYCGCQDVGIVAELTAAQWETVAAVRAKIGTRIDLLLEVVPGGSRPTG
jgi:hypothetical protein